MGNKQEKLEIIVKLETYTIIAIMETLGKITQLEHCNQELPAIQKIGHTYIGGWTVRRNWLAGWVQLELRSMPLC